MAHIIEIYERNSKGEAVGVIDAVWVCSDWCHRSYCEDNNLPYEGWNGCAEIPKEVRINKCATCSSLII